MLFRKLFLKALEFEKFQGFVDLLAKFATKEKKVEIVKIPVADYVSPWEEFRRKAMHNANFKKEHAMITWYPRYKSNVLVYVPQYGDSQLIEDLKNEWSKFPKEELVYFYQGVKDFEGTHKECLGALVLDYLFEEKFGKSPFQIEDDKYISLKGEIAFSYILQDFIYMEKN